MKKLLLSTAMVIAAAMTAFAADLPMSFTHNISAAVEGRHTWYGTHTFNGGAVFIVGGITSPCHDPGQRRDV